MPVIQKSTKRIQLMVPKVTKKSIVTVIYSLREIQDLIQADLKKRGYYSTDTSFRMKPNPDQQWTDVPLDPQVIDKVVCTVITQKKMDEAQAFLIKRT